MGDYILNLKSGQTSNIKTLFEVLKEVLLSDINIIFHKDYIKVTEIDGSEQAIVYLHLDSSAFEEYYCENEIIVGLNTPNFYKIIKIATANDTISLSIKRDEAYILLIKIENDLDKRIFESKLKLLDVPGKTMEIPGAEFPCVISIPSSKFQKNMKDLNSLGLDCKVNITNVANELIFSCVGDYSDNKVIFKESSVNTFKNNQNNIIQGIFSLKFIILFTKATSLCTTVSIYLKNDFPLILEYSVGVLGKLRFLLINNDEI